jgi:hypothetical protein
MSPLATGQSGKRKNGDENQGTDGITDVEGHDNRSPAVSPRVVAQIFMTQKRQLTRAILFMAEAESRFPDMRRA